jgi:hypothetical protein
MAPLARTTCSVRDPKALVVSNGGAIPGPATRALEIGADDMPWRFCLTT